MINEMLSGEDLYNKMLSLPEYDETYREKSSSERLIQLIDLYKVFIPSTMSTEVYSKLYLAVMCAFRKKEQKEMKAQQLNNFMRLKAQSYNGAGIIGGSDSFTIIGTPGIGKSTSIVRAMQLITGGAYEKEDETGYTKILPYIICQCPFDCSVKSLLLDILRQVDMSIGTTYYEKAIKIRVTTDMLIASVAQVAINHIGLLVVDEIQNVVNHKAGKQLVGMLTQLINNSGISICMVGTPECEDFFESTSYLARRTLGLKYKNCEYDDYFRNFCDTLFRYQYVKNKTEITEALRLWLYEHSKGVISVVVTLIHDAQEKAILDGSETLNLSILEKTYQERLGMLHTYLYEKKDKLPGPKRKKVEKEEPKDKGEYALKHEKSEEISKETDAETKRRNVMQDFSIIFDTVMAAKKNGASDLAEALKDIVNVIEVAV